MLGDGVGSERRVRERASRRARDGARVATRERERSVASVSRRDVLAARWEAHRVRARARRARAAVARRRRDGTRRRRRGDEAIGVERDDDDARRDQSRRRAWVDVCRVRMYRSRDEWGGVDENHRSITTSGRRDELRLERERKRRRHDVRGRRRAPVERQSERRDVVRTRGRRIEFREKERERL